MNTTQAAALAHVTIATICHWLRYGAVKGTKTAGRWVIDTDSLTRRIELNTKTPTKYTITTGTNRYGTPTHTVTLTDQPGAPGRTWEYINPTHAQFHLNIANQLPDGYTIHRDRHPARSMQTGAYWALISAETARNSRTGTIRTWNEDKANPALIIRIANEHAAEAPAREASRILAAENARIEAEAARRRAALEAQKGPLATEKQIDFIIRLIANRDYYGDGGGYITGYPTAREEIAELSRGEASRLISSLKEEY